VEGVPDTAWLRRNPWIEDHIKGGDAGLYDLLLNPRDRAFTVPQLATLVEGAGLRVACWWSRCATTPTPG
jgi:hypothetical protein